MRCGQASRALHLYIDERLQDREVTALQGHLADCAVCRAELAGLLTIHESLRAPELAPEPDVLHDRITRRIANYEARRALAASQARHRHEKSGLRRVGIAALLVAIMWTLSTLTVAKPATHWLSSQADSAIALLLAPGPAQVAWVLWLVGALVVAAIAWASRAHSTEVWREDLIRRLPQLPQLW
ncbi:MAG TPA: zf-HC2 domain-containing protein [Ktedonobacterales bacterium]